jgi:hypothetical protein
MGLADLELCRVSPHPGGLRDSSSIKGSYDPGVSLPWLFLRRQERLPFERHLRQLRYDTASFHLPGTTSELHNDRTSGDQGPLAAWKKPKPLLDRRARAHTLAPVDGVPVFAAGPF